MTNVENVSDIPALNQWLTDHRLSSYWARAGGPRSEFKPLLWKWVDLEAALTRAGQLVGTNGGQRVIRLKNPSLGEDGMKTVELSLQILLPGEHDEAHRHGEAGLRFVIQGTPGALTVVECEPMPMEAGDLITMPARAWHDCANEGTEPVVWLDAADGPLAQLGEVTYEQHSLPRLPIDKPVGFSANLMRPVKPAGAKGETPAPASRYGWIETFATLKELQESGREPDPCDGFRLTYASPLTGGATLTTLAGEVALLPASLRTTAHRHNSTTIYRASRGSGVTVINDERFEWEPGDVFVIPPGNLHYHETSPDGDAILVSITDRPALAALQLYREAVEA